MASLSDLPITGTIPWRDRLVYSGVTPIFLQHYTELDTYILTVDQAIDYHTGLESYVAHPAVSVTEAGFITPDLIQEFNDLKAIYEELITKVDLLLPDQIIIMYDGYTTDIPYGWKWCNGESSLIPESRYKFFLCASDASTYPLHSVTTNGNSTLIATLSNNTLPAHTHTFKNAYFAEKSGYSSDPHYSGTGVGSGASDHDNQFLYFPDYTDYTGTDTSSTDFTNKCTPYHVKVPYIIRDAHSQSTYHTVKITQPSSGSVLLNGTAVTSSSIPHNGIAAFTVTLPTSHELDSFTVNGVSYSLPYYCSVTTDLTVTCTVKERTCNITIKDTLGTTTVNGVKISSKDYTYGTALTVKSIPPDDYIFSSFTVTYKNTVATVSAASIEAVGFTAALSDAIESQSEEVTE